MTRLDPLDTLFVVWAFVLQIALIAHFAIRKPLFESYTLRYGWAIYALCIPALVVSLLILRGGRPASFWIGGFLFLLFAAFGFWVDYVARVPFRSPFRPLPGIPYVALYLAAVMFYWWPLGQLSRALWVVYGILFIVASALNITSH